MVRSRRKNIKVHLKRITEEIRDTEKELMGVEVSILAYLKETGAFTFHSDDSHKSKRIKSLEEKLKWLHHSYFKWWMKGEQDYD